MKIARLAEAFNLPVTSHGAHDVTVHLLAACPNRSYLEAHGFGLDRYIAEPLTIEDGVALAPESAGPRHRLRLVRARQGGGLGMSARIYLMLRCSAEGRASKHASAVRRCTGRAASFEARLRRAPQDEELGRVAPMKDPRRVRDRIDDPRR